MASPTSNVARALDADKMAKLGIRNTMRLAKAYNGLRRGRRQRMRVAEQRRFAPTPARRMEDGFLLDASLSLPHLDEMLAQTDEIIEERGGSPAVDDRYRAFFRNLISVDDLARWPALVDFVSSPELIAIVADYLGFIPALSWTLPTGVRVVESGKHLDALAHLPPRDSQVFHIDPYDHPMVYVIVLAKDCTPSQGPFTWLPASVSERASRELDYWSRGRPYRLSDEEIYSVVDPEETLRLTYPRGTVLLADTSRCFHYGARDADDPRFQVMYGLTSVCRSDFSESYMPFDRPPLAADADRLRRLVLDREA
ncbi:MAG TPA: hypothetical protein VGF21_16500 [Thermoleophilaceae bacterium]